jgi:hypothetical protein
MPQPGGLAGLFMSAADAAVKEPQREAAVASSGIPHVIVKVGVIQDVPGGSSSIAVQPTTICSGSSSSSSSSKQSSISREDLASAIVAGAMFLPDLGSSSSVAYEVADAGPGQPPESWERVLEGVVAART